MNQSSTFTTTEYTFLKYLSTSLQKSRNYETMPRLTEGEQVQVLALADRHEVLPLLGGVLETETLPEKIGIEVEAKSARTVHAGIRLQILNGRLTRILEEEGIKAITLKGCTVSQFYPIPEFRKSSDIDLFVDSEENARKAVQILSDNGFKVSEGWHANHHISMRNGKNEEVEIHISWADPFKDKQLNRCLERMTNESFQHTQLLDIQGVKVYAYERAWQAFYLLIHMLQHFVGSGFGIRNLCDWVVLWNSVDDEKSREDFWEMVCDSGTIEFARAVTTVCVQHLGLDPKKSPIPDGIYSQHNVADALLRDILDAGEFGYSEAGRMVGMDGNSLMSYVREFHHQMHTNFPKAGKAIPLWPALWTATLIRFLNNNRKLDRGSVSQIMKKAGERGQLVSHLTSRPSK